jgi:hypothetical protein
MKTNISKWLLVVGLIVIVAGCLLPWECSGDFVSYCDSGFGPFGYFPQPNLAFEINLIIFLGLAVFNLLIVGSGFARPWKKDGLLILDVGLFLGWLIQNGVISGYGGVLIVYLALISVWLTVRGDVFAPWLSRSFGLATSAIAVIVLVYNGVQILLRQISADYTALQYGIVVALVGGLIMLTIYIREYPKFK